MSGPIIGILGNTLMTQPGRFSSMKEPISTAITQTV